LPGAQRLLASLWGPSELAQAAPARLALGPDWSVPPALGPDRAASPAPLPCPRSWRTEWRADSQLAPGRSRARR
jgi:hypothetical protein